MYLKYDVYWFDSFLLNLPELKVSNPVFTSIMVLCYTTDGRITCKLNNDEAKPCPRKGTAPWSTTKTNAFSIQSSHGVYKT